MNMKKIHMYFHAGSKNHGCEAIVRSTASMLPDKPVLFSGAPEEDRAYGLDEIVDLRPTAKPAYSSLEKICCVINEKMFRSYKYGYALRAKHESKDYELQSVALSIGGDNYCYGEAYNLHLAHLNKSLKRRGIKTVLWGCSIEPLLVTHAMAKDFAAYDLITARETISYECLKQYNSKTVLVTDPAFALQTVELPFPVGFDCQNIIGINVSPLIQQNEKFPDIMIMNLKNLIKYILSNTSFTIALIPHVVSDGGDDRTLLRKLSGEFGSSGRVVLLEDTNCERLKGYISRCKFFIGARTHATIAAYSSCVPTLAIGYSSKAKGIAKDLFGTYENYVLPVQELKNADQLVNAYLWLEAHEKEITAHLRKIMPKYISGTVAALEILKGL